MHRPLLIFTIDGCDPAYLEIPGLTHLAELARRGFSRTVLGMMPSVTNVNHAAILTGAFPERHGIASNYWFDPASGRGGWIESDEHLGAPTLFEHVHRAGGRSALICAKRKLNGLFGRFADVSLSAEAPEPPAGPWGALYPAPPLTEPDNSAWVLRAAAAVIRQEHPDVVYVTTTDYLMHHAGPHDPRAEDHMRRIDRALGELLDVAGDREIYVTADHGMSDKHRLFNLQRYLDESGAGGRVVLPIEDRYSENHPHEESGSAYVYVQAPGGGGRIHDALEQLRQRGLAEAVLGRDEAAARFHLPAERIGEFLVLAAADVVFGSAEKMPVLEMPSPVRSHGSLHERTVPLVAYNSQLPAEQCRYSSDVVRLLLQDIGRQAAS